MSIVDSGNPVRTASSANVTGPVMPSVVLIAASMTSSANVSLTRSSHWTARLWRTITTSDQIAATSAQRSAATHHVEPPLRISTARPPAIKTSASNAHRGLGANAIALINKSCSSSGDVTSGRHSATTRSITSTSSLARSRGSTGSPRFIATERVRRSSSGASSRYVNGRPLRISCASTDGSVVSRNTTSMVLVSIPRTNSAKPSRSIASCRQSSRVCRTSG